MNKNYLRLLWKKSKLPVCFFSVLYLGIILVQIGTQDFKLTVPSYTYYYSGNLATVMSWNLTLSAIVCYTLPLILLSFVHRRKSADMYFALPLKRSEMLITTLVFSIGITWIVFAAGTLLCVMFTEGVALTSTLLVLVYGLIAIAALQMLNSVTYLFANNIFDGIVMMAAYSFMPLLLYFVNYMISESLIVGYNDGFPIITELAKLLSPVVLFYREILSIFRQVPEFNIKSLIALVVFIVVCGYLLYVHFVRRKTERADHLSDEKMAYPFVIHIYLIGCLMIFSSYIIQYGFQAEYVLYLIGLLAIYIVSQSVYRRKVEVTLKHLCIYGLGLACTLTIGWGIWVTHGFGLSDRNPVVNSSHYTYMYHIPIKQMDDGSLQAVDGYTDGARYYLEFDLEVTSSSAEKYEEAITILENNRQTSVNDYYDRNIDLESWYGTLVIQDTQAYPETKTHTYRLGGVMSIEELLIIEQYTKVNVVDNYTGTSVSLSEFLQK